MAKKLGPRVAGDSDVELGRRIKEKRIALQMSQGSLGEMLGVSFQQIQKYERGQNRVSAVRLAQIAGILDVPIGELCQTESRLPGIGIDVQPSDQDALDLLRAYRKISSQEKRQRLLALIESVAAEFD